VSLSVAGNRDLRLLLGARAVRAFGDGYISLLLPFYLKTLGFSAFQSGRLRPAPCSALGWRRWP
jgi:hypothetical protein